LTGMWSGTPDDWIPLHRFPGARAGRGIPAESGNIILWLPTSERAEIETITATPRPQRRETQAAPRESAELARSEPSSTHGSLEAREELGDAAASAEVIEGVRQKIQIHLRRLISEEWNRELAENSKVSDHSPPRILLNVKWSEGLKQVESVQWSPSDPLPEALRKRIEARLRTELLASVLDRELAEAEREAITALPRRLVLPVKFRRIHTEASRAR